MKLQTAKGLGKQKTGGRAIALFPLLYLSKVPQLGSML